MKQRVLSGWLALAGAILCEVVAALSLKGALHFPAFFGVVVLGYVASFACLSKVLRAGLPLSVAYAIWGAAGVVITALLSALLFGEALTLLMGAGILLTIVGVICVQLGATPKKSGVV